MARPHDQSDKHVMAGEVERLLRQLRPAPPRMAPSLSAASAPNGPGVRIPPMAGGRPAARSGSATAAPLAPVSLPSVSGVWGRVFLGALLAGAMTQWPFRTCGLSLGAYFASVAMVLVAGGWAGRASWRRRMGVAHVVAIAVVFAGLAFAASQVLPRAGYAPAPTSWRCPG